MARAKLGDAADGYDEESFAKGYEKGFNAGWRAAFKQGILIGKKLGRHEANTEHKNREGSEDSKSQCKSTFYFVVALILPHRARRSAVPVLMKCPGQCAF